MISENPREAIAAMFRKAGLHPSLVYAVRKTGFIVTEDSPHTPADRQEWAAAIDEWYEQNEAPKEGE